MMSRVLVISIFLTLITVCTHGAYCYDRAGAFALDTLVKKAEKEYAPGEKSSLNIQVKNGLNTNDYYFLSGLEILTRDKNIIVYSVVAYNQHLFHQSIPQMDNKSTEILLANFPILPELLPKVVETIQQSKNRKVKVALTIALRNSLLFNSDTVKFLSDQIRKQDKELLEATLFVLTPYTQSRKFVFLSSRDLKPVIDAIYGLPSDRFTPSSALLIEAMFSRSPYVTYFGVLDENPPYGTKAVKILEITKRVQSEDAVEKSARQSFRKSISRQVKL